MIQKCLVGSGVKEYSETVLWTNPNTSTDFAAQTVTINDDYTKYKYIGIYCKAIKTASDSDVKASYFKPEDMSYPYVNDMRTGITCVYNSGLYGRNLRHSSDENNYTIYISAATGGTSVYTNVLIPIKIVGLK